MGKHSTDKEKKEKKPKAPKVPDADALTAEKDKKEKKEKKDKKDKKDKKEKKDMKDKNEKNEKKDKKDKKDKKEIKDKKEQKEHITSDKKRVAEDTGNISANGSSEKKPKTSSTAVAVTAFLEENAISIEPIDKSTPPALSFDDLTTLHPKVLSFLSSQYKTPTPIQSVAWPFLLQGKDVVGVAETGSGKTMAFGVPAIHHLLTNKSANKGVKVVVVSPTRELAMQIHDNLTTLSSNVDISAVCVYGGVSKEDQKQALRRGASIVIATPGRLNDLLNEGSCDLSGVEYLVLDEADRMLEKGFEEDIKRIISYTPNKDNRQTLMFTATWPQEVRDLASTFMRNDETVKISIGDRDELSANKSITQVVEVIDPFKKEQRLLQLLKENQSGAKKNDKILVFALYKKEAARVERLLQGRGYQISAIHGDLNQYQRTKALDEFKKGETKILLATDVAARGLDIPAVKVVINLTFPLTAEDYVHRIGRTGRAGQTGLAITLFTEQEKHLSGALINVLRGADQPVPEDLLKFGSHTKKKEHGVYGAFYKDIDNSKKATKIKFD